MGIEWERVSAAVREFPIVRVRGFRNYSSRAVVCGVRSVPLRLVIIDCCEQRAVAAITIIYNDSNHSKELP